MVKDSFVGKAGQLAVMAEFLLRGYNVAVPEVDVGDDILVVSNPVEVVWCVQVKTATEVRRGYGYSGQFLIPLAQLRTPTGTPLFFVFALREDRDWEFAILD